MVKAIVLGLLTALFVFALLSLSYLQVRRGIFIQWASILPLPEGEQIGQLLEGPDQHFYVKSESNKIYRRRFWGMQTGYWEQIESFPANTSGTGQCQTHLTMAGYYLFERWYLEPEPPEPPAQRLFCYSYLLPHGPHCTNQYILSSTGKAYVWTNCYDEWHEMLFTWAVRIASIGLGILVFVLVSIPKPSLK